MTKYTPYYLFINQVDIIDRSRFDVVKKSYLLHIEMGYPNLYKLFKDGKRIEYMERLIEM